MVKRYRQFGTTADVGVVSYGTDMKTAFENQAAGMFSLMVDMRGVADKERFLVEAKADDPEGLLVAFLGELLFIFETKDVFLRRFRVASLGGGRLKAEAFGEPIEPGRHVIKTQVKAVTYHMLEVRSRAGTVSTRVVYDI